MNVAAVLLRLGEALTSADGIDVRCPSAILDAGALVDSLAVEVPGEKILVAHCEATGRAGAAQLVFELPGRAPIVVQVGDVTRSLRPRTAALALNAALTSPSRDLSVASSSSPAAADALPRDTGESALADAAWSLDAGSQFAWFGDLYVGGELSRRIDLTGWRPGFRPVDASLVLGLSLLGTSSWRADGDYGGINADWSFALWARTGVEVDFALLDNLRFGPELLIGGGANLFRDGTVGYGLAALGVHLGWAFSPGVELLLSVRGALRYDTEAAEPGIEGAIGLRFPLWILD